MNGLPCGSCQRITIDAGERPLRADRSDNDVGIEMPGVTRSGWNEGVGEHVRTRSHRANWVPGEIADLKQSAPYEENLFLPPDRLREA